MTEPLNKITLFHRGGGIETGRLAKEVVLFSNQFPEHFDAAIAGADIAIEVESNDGVSHFEDYAQRASCPTALWLIDTHVAEVRERHRKIISSYSHIFLAIPHHVEIFAQWHPRVSWLPLCKLHPSKNFPSGPKEYSLGFIGNEQYDYYRERTRLLNLITETFPNEPIFRGLTPPGAEYESLLRRFRIGFNRSTNKREDTNYRVFETMAEGTLLLTDHSSGIESLFENKKHLVLYEDDTELLEAIAYYLAHPEEREYIAAMGKAEVLARHLGRDRVISLINTVLGTQFSRDDF